MQCCVPSCENTSKNLSRNNEITFHMLPCDAHLRATWLRALGLQHAPLRDSALVCSQHFLSETDNSSQQLRPDAVLSTIQICITCLDTDSKMLLMDHKLENAYEKLTGFPVCDGGNLSQALCVQCAHRLRHFSRFRDMSLRARSLMMELVKKHQSITKSHIKMLKSGTDQLKNNLGITTLEPNHCDLHIVHYDGDKQPISEETSVVVKKECIEDSILVEIEEEAINEQYSSTNCVEVTVDPLKHESASYICTVCYEELHDAHAYSAHASMHDVTPADSAPMIAPLSTSSATKTENEEHPTEEDYKNPKNSAPWHTVSYYDSSSTHTARVADPTALTCSPDTSSHTQTFICDICLRTFTKRRKFVYHIRTHKNEKPYSCPRKLCGYKCTQRGSFVTHMLTHTGEKPYTCEVCNYKCVSKSTIVKHVNTHNDIKPYSCTLCKYKSKRNYDLARHMKIHTGEKPFSCDMCSYKSSEKIKLIYHIRTHTGEKPYSCTMCDYKCTQSASLVKHVRVHKKKPFSCKFCEYTCAKSGSLARHMKVHTH